MTYSPPGYSTFKELFDKAYAQYFNDGASLSQLVSGYAIYNLDDDNRGNIEKIMNNQKEALEHTFSINKHDIRPSVDPENIRLTCISFNDDQYTFRQEKGKNWSFSTELLRQFVHITKILKLMRDALCSTVDEENKKSLNKLSFLTHDNQTGYIPNHIWLNDRNWHGLIYNGKILSECAVTSIYPDESANEVVHFNKRLVDKIFIENAVIPLNQITMNFIQSINDGSITFRAAERLHQLFKTTHPIEFVSGTQTYKITEPKKYKKENLVDCIEEFAKKHGFTVVSPQEEKGYDMEKSVSRMDADAIATLLRSLSQQSR